MSEGEREREREERGRRSKELRTRSLDLSKVVGVIKGVLMSLLPPPPPFLIRSEKVVARKNAHEKFLPL